MGAVIGVNLAAKAVPLAGGYSLVTPSAAVDGTQDLAKGALSGKAEDQVLTPGFALPRNPGDIIYAPAAGGAVTGPAYDNQAYLLTHPPIGGSTFLDGADQRHAQAVAADSAVMLALREAARLHGAPLVDSAARVEAQAVAENAAIMQGLREQARLHGAPLVDPAARLKAQAVAENAAIMQGLREAASNKSVESLSLFASPYFGRIPTSAAITPTSRSGWPSRPRPSGPTSRQASRRRARPRPIRRRPTAWWAIPSPTRTATSSLERHPPVSVPSSRTSARAFGPGASVSATSTRRARPPAGALPYTRRDALRRVHPRPRRQYAARPHHAG